ncbi:O-linked N-acetylglucosamine transferase, SPINDLY family protein [Lyngbya confervoides]|uniref:O-linked N-acetylglucosamine transferase, SPINDLY family protein n=1 Tax=Lyngbya confervoides BDU141951 TaxID=1574623 RepID=A0ABD4T9G2_9CYAN|nr:O-linked N-acetylglucosamine transferase, SPINDLY family protein [Lyngbya confervoides]MCM1985246.1 O-linked N-acetylglucosamine transferase, SPINDLY family protein [Lyngbya confervoides BDU141951]
MKWHSNVYDLLSQKKYSSLVEFYEKLVGDKSADIETYIHLSLSYLLNNQEEDAQAIWLYILSETDHADIEYFVNNLAAIFDEEAKRLTESHEYTHAWVIRQYIREHKPNFLSNLIELISLSIKIECFSLDYLEEWCITELIENHPEINSIELRLVDILLELWSFPDPKIIHFSRICFSKLSSLDTVLPKLISKIVYIGEEQENPTFAADLSEELITVFPEDINVLKAVSRFSHNSRRYKRSVEVSKKLYSKSSTLSLQFISNYQILKSLAYSGSWLEILPIAQLHKELMLKIFNNVSSEEDWELKHLLIAAGAFLSYLQDDLEENRSFHNKIGNLFQKNLRPLALKKSGFNYSSRKKIKIGYIAHTLRRHSVGWLSRWLFEHHDREKFDISIYFINESLEDDFYANFFKSKADSTYSCGLEAREIAQRIQDDKIDILVDLDSVSLNITYEVMALKPAPIQITWLGWDAPGLSTIDYFIADPYVLSDSAQKYYVEKIWRLPHSYVAVDGFEVGIPTLRRSDLNIDIDSVVYLSSQAGAKRHPETASLQMKIIKQVPNSIFLIKTVGDSETIKDFFIHIAQQEGINPNRLRFFPWDPDEYTHRANLLIADVVLDTYPYNGATTTLETLWMGNRPRVERKNERFRVASRLRYRA